MKYHINAKGEARPCKAVTKCPFGDLVTDHYESTQEAQSAFEEKMKLVASPTSFSRKNKAISEMVNYVLNEPLYPAVDKPKWWDNQLNEDDVIIDGNEPQLLQKISTPDGDMAVVWYDQSPIKQDQWPREEKAIETTVTYLKNWETGEIISALRLSYMSDETIKSAFGDDELTLYRFQESFHGSRLGFRKISEDIKDTTSTMNSEELSVFKRNLWASAIKSQLGTPASWRASDGYAKGYWNASSEYAPTDPTVIDGDLKEMAVNIKKDLDESKDFWKEPLPAFSEVKNRERDAGKGYGSIIYLVAARKLAEKDQVLKAASSRTDDARRVWARFEANEAIPTGTVTKVQDLGRGKIQEDQFTTLDFRGKK